MTFDVCLKIKIEVYFDRISQRGKGKRHHKCRLTRPKPPETNRGRGLIVVFINTIFLTPIARALYEQMPLLKKKISRKRRYVVHSDVWIEPLFSSSPSSRSNRFPWVLACLPQVNKEVKSLFIVLYYFLLLPKTFSGLNLHYRAL